MSDTAPDQEFEHLLEYLQRTRGFDFSGYKRASLMRRVTKRVEAVGMKSFASYQDHLDVDPGEFARLFDSILINVTSFFRDPPAWEYLRSEIVPRVLEEKPDPEPIRAWTAGCATGEETYSLAMLLADALGREDFLRRVKIFATDLDEEALSRARAGSYDGSSREETTARLWDKYFSANGNRHAFDHDLRHAVIFGRHNLVQDAPISRVDLLVCRNLLMYLNAETQTRVLSRLHFALNDSGYLFLGKAEMLLTHTDLFLPVNMKFRVFRRIPGNPGLERRALLAAQPVAEMPRAPGDRETRLRELAFEAAPVAQVLLDAAGNVITGNLHARKIFGLRDRDMGRPFHELEVSYRPVDLGSLIQSAISQRRTLSLNNVERLVPGESAIQYLDLQVVPMLDDASIIGVSILFNDVTDHVRLQSDLEHSKADLESAYEEVQSSHEELETTNEELQSSNEELETTNEELQSANEELETMNEELNSTNEELQTMNDELRQRTQELDQSNAFLGAVVASLGEAVIVVDPKLRILIWNQRSEDLWGLRSEEVTGRPLMDLEIGLPLTPVKALVDDCLTGRSNHARAVLDATNRRGKSVRCSVICAPLVGQRSERVGVILSMAETKA